MVTPDVTDLFERELGRARVLKGPEKLEPYGRDESGLGVFPPECAVLCESAEEVALVLRVAAERKIAVTPRGAGTGMTGGALPVAGGIVLSTERMQKIREISEEDLIAVVEPGVILGPFQEQVEARGLFYPPDPASLAMCSIGGNVAENAGGPRAFRYGVTREYVLGLDVTLMGGEALTIGRRTSKGVTGYDLVAAFVGSEGTFGVSTSITLKLVPHPTGVATLLAVFPTLAAAGEAISDVLRAGFRPRALELLDKFAIDHVRPRAEYRFPKDAEACALIELDGEPEGMEAAAERAGQACERRGAVEVRVAKDDAERRKLWQARRIVSPSLRDAHKHKISEDIAVPRGSIPEMLRRVAKMAEELEQPVATYGHAGDGNLHVNLLVDEPLDRHPKLRARVDRALERLFTDTIALKGTLSGEHGIGLTKKDFIALEQPANVIAWQKRLKRMWDPEDLLNPGKIFP